mmetsp:Transcript_25265/g.70681  ORF Transcript_25265/g.70681 Transcript_25265/m.70681 type:complete len:164 (+) Transcript_25265:325-816(+)
MLGEHLLRLVHLKLSGLLGVRVDGVDDVELLGGLHVEKPTTDLVLLGHCLPAFCLPCSPARGRPMDAVTGRHALSFHQSWQLVIKLRMAPRAVRMPPPSSPSASPGARWEEDYTGSLTSDAPAPKHTAMSTTITMDDSCRYGEPKPKLLGVFPITTKPNAQMI